MSLCEAGTASFTTSQLRELYSGSLAISPVQSPPDSDRNNDEYKLLNTRALTEIVKKLKEKNTIPTAPRPNAENIDEMIAQHRERLNALATSIRNEYCWYYKRYAYAIENWIVGISDSRATANTRINEFGQASIELNRRLIDITTIIAAITEDQYSTASKMSTDINSLNGELENQFSKLKRQAEVLQKEAPEAEMKKRMVEYTKEKSKANNNLLSFYFFLDVVALGILFYVYRA